MPWCASSNSWRCQDRSQPLSKGLPGWIWGPEALEGFETQLNMLEDKGCILPPALSPQTRVLSRLRSELNVTLLSISETVVVQFHVDVHCAGLNHNSPDISGFLTKDQQSFLIATFAPTEPVAASPCPSRSGARFQACSGKGEPDKTVAQVSAGCRGQQQHACLAWLWLKERLSGELALR